METKWKKREKNPKIKFTGIMVSYTLLNARFTDYNFEQCNPRILSCKTLK